VPHFQTNAVQKPFAFHVPLYQFTPTFILVITPTELAVCSQTVERLSFSLSMSVVSSIGMHETTREPLEKLIKLYIGGFHEEMTIIFETVVL
jgi:hypothetical protein